MRTLKENRAKFFVLPPTFEALHGCCPVCGGVMDETGCRLREHLISTDIASTRGIAQVVEVLVCAGAPFGAVLPCPSYEGDPAR